MRKAVFTVVSILTLQAAWSQSLFRITENGKVGYIDNKGEKKIQPQFNNAGYFSDGLAPARKNGLYGFINEAGTFIIQPQFDFATGFYKGIAAVYKRGIPEFINRSGFKILPSAYKEIIITDDNTAIVTTYGGRKGLINLKTGKLLADTVFNWIRNFNCGVAVGEEYVRPSKKGMRRMAVIDSTGKFVITFGKFQDIKDFHDGLSVADIRTTKDNDEEIAAIINTKGEILFKMPYSKGSVSGIKFSEGYANVNFYRYTVAEDKSMTYSGESYYSYIDSKGQVIFNDSSITRATDFSNGRAFIRGGDGYFILIDRKFKQVGKERFDNVNEFKNNYAIVHTREGAGIIDTSGNFIIKPQRRNIHEIGVIDNYFFVGEWNANSDEIYGITDLDNNEIIKPTFQQFDQNGFDNGLLQVMIDERLAWIDRAGKIVWEQKSTEVPGYLDIDFMNRGYFYAHSSPDTRRDPDEIGGYYASRNYPDKIKFNNLFPENSLSVRIDSTQKDTFDTKYYGYKLFISNTTTDTAVFEAQDSRLYMKLQAKDHNGRWKDIEYLPSSWCGNSYHKIRLEPGAYWSFTIPDYKGEFTTLVRAQLEYIDNKNPDKTKTIYSNTIQAGINPGQFWNKRRYYPSGIMDPYYD